MDAKILFDDNGLFRHKEIAGLRDLNEEDPLEVEAQRFNFFPLRVSVGLD